MSAAVAAVLLTAAPTSAQNLIHGTDVGLHVVGTRPAVTFRDGRTGTLLHAFLRRQWGERTQQEINIGLGLIEGIDFKTRILPVDARILAFPFRYSQGRVFPGLHYGDLYAYAGLGMVNVTPIEIPRPDDPLTVDAGSTLRGSTYLDLTTNWSIQVPVGVGTTIHLDDDTQMVFHVGYHLTTAKELEGYFGMSVGLKFSKPFRPRRTAPTVFFPLTATSTPTLVVPAPAAKEPVRVETFAPMNIRFESSRSEVRPSEMQAILDAARFLKRNPSHEVVLRAHADSSGYPGLNRILAEDRAWQATVALMKQGVDAVRIRRESYSADRPIQSNTTPEGRTENRRLEIIIRPVTEQRWSQDAPNTDDLSRMDMADGWSLTFDTYGSPLDLALTEAMRVSVLALAAEMRSDPAIRVRVTGYHDYHGSQATRQMLALAQASQIQRLLIEAGVEPTRIETLGLSGRPRRTDLLRVTETR